MSTEKPFPMPPAVVLCGGLGTRLRGVVRDVPKVLAPVAGVPFADHLLGLLARQGVRDVVLAAGFGAEKVRDSVGDGAAWGLRARTVSEPSPLGTAGAARFARDAAGITGPFFVINGDSLFTGDLRALVGRHTERTPAVATLALVRVPDASRYGTVEFDGESGAVTRYMEKAEGSAGPAWISAGTYLLSEAALDGQTPGRPGSMERDVFPGLVGRGLRALPYPRATFIDIGTPDDYARAARILKA